MKIKNNLIELNGAMSIVLFDSVTNKIQQEFYYPNLVVTSGRNWAANRVLGTGGTVAMQYMAIGTTNTAPVDGDTTLKAEAGNRVALNTPTISGSVITFSATFPAGNPSSETALTEAGIFTASTNGIMLCRSVFPVITKATNSAIAITWTISM